MTPRSLNKLVNKLIVIEWEDSFDANGGKTWNSEREAEEKLKSEMMVRSSGWLVAINDRKLVLASDKAIYYPKEDNFQDDYGRLIVVPRSLVRMVKVIKI